MTDPNQRSMIRAKALQDNPNLFVFLPLFYTVWSDAILTPREMSILQDLIQSQDWITEKEKEFLQTQLDPSSPPTPDDFKEWLTEIRKVIGPEEEQRQSLIDIGIRLAQSHDGSTMTDTLKRAQKSLQPL